MKPKYLFGGRKVARGFNNPLIFVLFVIFYDAISECLHPVKFYLMYDVVKNQ